VVVIKKIADHCNKLGTYVVFRFFLAEKGSEFLGVSFTESITKYLGDHIEIYSYLPYNEYMETMQEVRFSIDSFHFGRCNTVVDNLHIKKTIITIEGTKWYNRIGAGLLRKIGLNELIVKNKEEYFNKICECILFPQLLEQITNKVKLTDMSPLYNDQEAVEGLVKVIEKLINEL
jgi:predicted O-linked N-acetylglucosamine transferase (SPINDLY family)